MSKFIDLTGQRFGRLLVMHHYGKSKNWQSTWLCKCDCGAEVVVVSQDLRNGHTKSCGCLRKEASIKHGLCATNPKLYLTIRRHWEWCYKSAHKYYPIYGRRGWYFAREWLLPNGKPDYKTIGKWAIDNGWDDSDKSLIFEKDKLSNELGIKEIGPRTVRFVHLKENASYQKRSIKVIGTPLAYIARLCGIDPTINGKRTKPYYRLLKAVGESNPVNSLIYTIKDLGIDDLKLAEVKQLLFQGRSK